jgi:hypothetical protein
VEAVTMVASTSNAGNAARGQSEQDAIDHVKVSGIRPSFVAQLGVDYEHGPNLFRATRFHRHSRGEGEPLYRPLWIYMTDPVESGYAGRTAVVLVPYETLTAGPVGAFLEVVGELQDGAESKVVELDLNNSIVLLSQGLKPSAADVLFHRQMVYAVCSDVAATFTIALGRDLSWGFDRAEGKCDRLRLRPHYADDRNAYYHKQSGELRFGQFEAEKKSGVGILPGGRIYTCLSHDIVAHEMTHALLDGMRARFDQPTNPDVLAFHEAFADLVAVLQHFSHPQSVRDAIARTAGRLADDLTIFALADEFGRATGMNSPMRSALRRGDDDKGVLYTDVTEPHERASYLVSAIMEALSQVFERRAEPVKTLYELNAGASGRMHPACVDLLADLATKVAGQFLALCIRAIDYCPPVDITFGEYLRAMITADRELVEDDKHKFRAELIAAFARRKIFPSDVTDISEDALLWKGPSIPLPDLPGLQLSALQLKPDPGQTPDPEEIEREVGALADVVSDPRYSREFRIVRIDSDFGLPTIESMRILRRVGPDRQVMFGLVCEVLQTAKSGASAENAGVVQGSTIILDGAGVIRFVIRKQTRPQASSEGSLPFHVAGDQSGADEGLWARVHAAYRR